jgi:HAD superfamily hydrolase (TIGR01484 family)
MSVWELLLACDMDQTVIPNGKAPEAPGARQRFGDFCADSRVQLVYVTGRDIGLVEAAMAEYHLPMPEFVITDVGAQMYAYDAQTGPAILPDWHAHLAQGCPPEAFARIDHHLKAWEVLQPQEPERQKTFKHSYYVEPTADMRPLVQEIKAHLAHLGLPVSVIWSFDDAKNVWLLDILAREANKLDALLFLCERQGIGRSERVFAGDSGNDLAVMESELASILVANANDSVRAEAERLAAKTGREASLYLAENGGDDALDHRCGHYADGVLQGVWQFVPAARPLLTQIGADFSDWTQRKHATNGGR